MLKWTLLEQEEVEDLSLYTHLDVYKRQEKDIEELQITQEDIE